MLLLDYDRFSIGNADDVRSQWPLAEEPALAIEQIPLHPPGRVEMPESDWLVLTEIRESQPELQDRWMAVFDFEKCRGQISLRRRRPGDRFQPQGLKGHTQSLGEFMIDQKIPRAARGRLPVLVDEDHILWVCGWRIDERVRATSETRQYLTVKFERKVASWEPTR
jgi:tRNA(Ile)-lysidine synthase